MSVINFEDGDYTKMKVVELKAELKKRGLSSEGKKNELIERLQGSIGDSALLDDTHDDLLDEDVLSDEEVLNMDTPPEINTAANVNKRPAEEDEKRHPKKIILNRNVVEVSEPTVESEKALPVKEASNVDKPAGENEEAAKTIKLTSVSQKERLAQRAARFSSSDSKAPAVFVSTNKETKSQITLSASTKNSTPSVLSSVNVDVLKKRAERFGTVAPVLEKVQLEEKKKQRLDRFGGGKIEVTGGKVAITLDKPAITLDKSAIQDKKALRAARFQK